MGTDICKLDTWSALTKLIVKGFGPIKKVEINKILQCKNVRDDFRTVNKLVAIKDNFSQFKNIVDDYSISRDECHQLASSIGERGAVDLRDSLWRGGARLSWLLRDCKDNRGRCGKELSKTHPIWGQISDAIQKEYRKNRKVGSKTALLRSLNKKVFWNKLLQVSKKEDQYEVLEAIDAIVDFDYFAPRREMRKCYALLVKMNELVKHYRLKHWIERFDNIDNRLACINGHSTCNMPLPAGDAICSPPPIEGEPAPSLCDYCP